MIEQLTTFGLIDCREERYGFRDLTAARQLSELLQSGVSLSTITRSLHEIRKWLPDAALSNLRLYPASSDAVLVEHLKGRTDQRGQFVLPVDEARDDADKLFEQAQAAEDAKDVETAERLYRKVMRIDPGDPTAAFNLGNLLRAAGQKVKAEAAYRAATKADPRFAEAWYNLADMLDEQKPLRQGDRLSRARRRGGAGLCGRDLQSRHAASARRKARGCGRVLAPLSRAWTTSRPGRRAPGAR